MLFLWKNSKIYCRKPRWLPVFYLSRSYSGIKNFTLRFYKILEDASKTLFRHVSWLVFLSVLDYKSCFILFESMIVECQIDCNSKIILYKSTSDVRRDDCNSGIILYGSTIVWGCVDLKSCNFKRESIVLGNFHDRISNILYLSQQPDWNLLTSILLASNLSHIQQKKDMTYS